MSFINSERHKINRHFPTKYPQMLGLYISRKTCPFQLSRRVKDYLRQGTALHSLLLRYRFSYSTFIARPRMQSLRFADTRPNGVPYTFLAELRVLDLAGVYYYILARLDRWLASIWRGLSRMTKFGNEKARSGLTTGVLARVCPDFASCLTGPRIVRTLTVLIRESSAVIGSLPSRQHRLNWLMATEYSPAS